MKDEYIRRDRAYRRRRRKNKIILLRILLTIALLAVVSLLLYGAFWLINKGIRKNETDRSVQKVTLSNLDGNPENPTQPSQPDTEKPTQKETDSTESSSQAVVEKPTKTYTPSVPLKPGEFDELIYFYGNTSEGSDRVVSYTDEPYKYKVKEGFTPLDQIYRSPRVEEFMDDGFFNNTLFVGDSITTGITIYADSYGYNMPANVLADKGYTIGKIMLRKDEIVAYNPERMFILVGSNDLNNVSPDIEKIATRYIQAVNELQASLPNTKIYIILTLPINTKYEQKASIRNDRITEFDKRLVQLCNEQGIYYIDMATSLKDSSGMLREELTSDGLHLKGQYYPYWYNLIKDVIKTNE